jgi:hypothetical protein
VSNQELSSSLSPSMSETNKAGAAQHCEKSTQIDVPPSPLALEIKFIPDRTKEGIGAEADIPPIPSSLEMRLTSDTSKEGFGPEADVQPIPSSLEIRFIPDRHKEGVAGETDISPTSLAGGIMGFIPDRCKEDVIPDSTSAALASSMCETYKGIAIQQSSQDVPPSPLA